MPKISVLTPIYSPQELHLRIAIESILNQTFKDFEFIILNDCPEDIKSESIVYSYKDERIIYLKNEQNLGISASRNKLISLAKGKYLAIFDHDDISLPLRLATQNEYLDTHKDCGVVGSFYTTISKNKNQIKTYPINHDEIKKAMLSGMSVLHTSLMIRKSILTKHNISYKQQFFPAEDYAFCGDLIDKTTFHNIPEVLVKYRNHKQNTSSKNSELMRTQDLAIKKILRQKHNKLWQEIEVNKTTITRSKLFNIIPTITTKEKANLKKYYLLGFIPFYTTRTKTTYI
ncbi:MAG: glycosyltransferase [Alphaproteobacteria bacterium]|nr:glycosyltransferase [Alphaproteobacteria bacterium]